MHFWTHVLIWYPGDPAEVPDSTKLALNLGLAAGLECIDWFSYNQTDILPTTTTGWSAPANAIELNTSLGYVKDVNLVGGFYTDHLLRALIARLGLGANPPKTVITTKIRRLYYDMHYHMSV